MPITKPTLKASQGGFVAVAHERNNDAANVINPTNRYVDASSRAVYDDNRIINNNNIANNKEG